MTSAVGRWLRDLVRDVLWAKARVMIEGGWKTRPAWRYVRFVKHRVPIPDELAKMARGHYRPRHERRAGVVVRRRGSVYHCDGI